MENLNKPKKESLVLIGAKVPADIKEFIEKKAEKDERSISQTIARLLSSHPEVQKSKSLALPI